MVLAIMVITISCKQKKEYSKLNTVNASEKAATHKVLVEEVKDADIYTYVKVKEDDKSYWMAISKTDVEVGGTYYYDGGMAMKNFESKQFNIIYDEIVFADGLRDTPEKPVADNPHKNITETAVGEIKISTPENGISLEELFKNKENYSKKSVVVKGVVTKVNREILEKNWIHIADGTSFDKKKSLTVSTKEIAKLGDTVTFKGVVTLNKDFGYGYVYDILLEEGTLIK